jgi:hypothetical protein
MSIALKYGSVEQEAKRVSKTAKKPKRNEASRNKRLSVRAAVHFRWHSEGRESRGGPVWKTWRFQSPGESAAESSQKSFTRKD